MAWRVRNVEDQRKEFIEEYLSNQMTITELCEMYQISRKTGYKWIGRFEEEGIDGLIDRSKAPHNQIGKTDDELIDQIIDLRKKFPKWGPKKIVAYLTENKSFEEWPSTTTIGKILHKEGLIQPRKQRRRFPAKSNPLSHCHQANDVWCIDFKGWHKTKDNIKCDPLTITDAFSRFLLCCNKLAFNTADYTWKVLEEVFQKYGLPRYLRHDNGPPFATCGSGRLSRLSINIIKAGVIPEWIEPGKPYQNGRHERMHLTLKQEGIKPLTLKEQQMHFREFQAYFNFERPHEALAQKTPGSVYKPSTRQWTGKLEMPEYSKEYEIKKVRSSGQISWHGKEIFLGKVLENELVGIKEEDGGWSVFYGPVLLGHINPENGFSQPARNVRPKRDFKVRIF